MYLCDDAVIGPPGDDGDDAHGRGKQDLQQTREGVRHRVEASDANAEHETVETLQRKMIEMGIEEKRRRESGKERNVYETNGPSWPDDTHNIRTLALHKEEYNA